MLIFISNFDVLVSWTAKAPADRALSTCLGGSEAKWRGAMVENWRSWKGLLKENMDEMMQQ